jgi:uncharacterized tellurite resistance protein B-like protein
MDVRHSIEIVALVDGARVHRSLAHIDVSGPVSDLLQNFDPALAVAAMMRLEADLIQDEAERKRQRKLTHADFEVIDGDTVP